MNEILHAELPWRIDEDIFIVDGSDRDCANTNVLNQRCDRKETAEFIVRACNVHYELLEACRKTLNAIRNCRFKNEEPGETELLLMAAIEKATGETP